MKMLVAEDNAVSAKLLETNLKKWGYEVVTTTDGEATLEAYRGDETLQMAILDWMMPRMAGTDVCKVIKQDSEVRFTYVIMLTGKTEKQDIAEALEGGADDYVTKPFDSTELRARVMAGERIINLQNALAVKIKELESALAHVRQLQGILPICAWCKKVRDDSDYWSSVEDYVAHHSKVHFSHGICPDCMRQHYPEEAPEKEKPTSSS